MLRLVLVSLLLMVPLAEARAQQVVEAPFRHPADLLHAKVQAKAKRELQSADLPELARDRAEAARAVYHERAAEFVVGRGSLVSLLESVAHVRNAELAMTDRVADRHRIRDTDWLTLWYIDDIVHAIYEAGRTGIRDYLLVRYNRLGAEVELARAGARQSASAALLPAVQATLVPDENAGLLNAKKVARAKFDALHADPRSLLERRLRAAQLASDAQMKECLAGRGSFYLLVRWDERVRDAGIALAATDTERFAYIEDFWRTAWHGDRAQELRRDAGRIPIQDYLTTHYERIDADIGLAQAWAKLPKKATRTSLASAYQNFSGESTWLWPDDGLGAKDSAKAKFGALHANAARPGKDQARSGAPGVRGAGKGFFGRSGSL